MLYEAGREKSQYSCINGHRCNLYDDITTDIFINRGGGHMKTNFKFKSRNKEEGKINFGGYFSK
jgi:hypothetical protein